MLWRTFHTLSDAKDLISDFELLKIEIPLFVQNCYEEIIIRSDYVDKMVENKSYVWSASETSAYKERIENEVQQNSYDIESRRKYLGETFDKLRLDILRLEKTVTDDYHYHINNVIDIESATTSTNDLNEYFFHCEKEKGNIGEFLKLARILKVEIVNKNTLRVLKEVIKSNEAQISRPEITQPNKPITPWETLIKVELHVRLMQIESGIQDKIAKWRERNNLIECAAFCQLLYDWKFFYKGSTKRKSVNEFALSKYKIDIEIQLQSSANEGRENHKKFLKKYFL